VNDIRTLATDNRHAETAEPAAADDARRRLIPYVFVAPREVDSIGRLATRVFREHYAGAWPLLRSSDMAVLGRLVGGGEDSLHGELLSYLFFAPEFTRALLEQGRSDGERWLGEKHDDGIWRTTSQPP
jgi:NTE family protein